MASIAEKAAENTRANLTRVSRAEVKARREARFDIRQGSVITARDAEAEARRFDPASTQHAYWKAYASEMRAKGHR